MKISYSVINISNTHEVNLLSVRYLKHLNALVRNVSPDSREVTEESMRRFLLHSGFLVCALTPKGKMVGMLTLLLCYKVNSCSGRLEHVSVLPEFGGRGIARTLMAHAISKAKDLKLKHIDLTCEPRRERANALYESCGFKIGTTNVRRLCLD